MWQFKLITAKKNVLYFAEVDTGWLYYQRNLNMFPSFLINQPLIFYPSKLLNLRIRITLCHKTDTLNMPWIVNCPLNSCNHFPAIDTSEQWFFTNLFPTDWFCLCNKSTKHEACPEKSCNHNSSWCCSGLANTDWIPV